MENQESILLISVSQSACNLVFRTNFLEPESIGIIPPHGYKPEQNQSIKAIKWLKYLKHTEGIHVQHAMNGGEKQIDPYPVDDYSTLQNGERVVYEFHGCFWHGCTTCFSRNTTNPVMSDLYQKTMDKQRFIEQEGYKYISIWECDFSRQCKENIDMKAFIDLVDISAPWNPEMHFKVAEQKLLNYIWKLLRHRKSNIMMYDHYIPISIRRGKFHWDIQT